MMTGKWGSAASEEKDMRSTATKVYQSSFGIPGACGQRTPGIIIYIFYTTGLKRLVFSIGTVLMLVFLLGHPIWVWRGTEVSPGNQARTALEAFCFDARKVRWDD